MDGEGNSKGAVIVCCWLWSAGKDKERRKAVFYPSFP
jgi:hypothetical protein